MKRQVAATDAKRLIEEHLELKSKLEDATILQDRFQYRLQISTASGQLVEQETMEALSEISLEEIRQNRNGFRIKPLQDRGYNTFADLSKAISMRSLASTPGIGMDSIKELIKMVSNTRESIRQSVKIRLSTDRRNAASDQLVTAISKYRESLLVEKVCRELLDANAKRIDYALEDLSPAVSGLGWFFSSKAKKQRAVEAYHFLKDSLVEGYGQEARAALGSLRAIREITASEAWEDFSKNSIQFFNILEEINPGVLGTADATYGLSESLSLEIEKEAFYTDGLKCTLRRYQEWGVRYILHQERVLLGDEMGLGKTIQAIAAMVSLTHTGATHFAVVCPAGVIVNWCKEIENKSVLTPIKIHGQGRMEALELWVECGGVAVTNYETLEHWFLKENFRFSLLVADEAHYVKNAEAQRTRNIKKLIAHADRLLFMTGTALENQVKEMVHLIGMLQPNIAAKVRKMDVLYTAPKFREIVAPVYYRRKREDVLTELPELIERQEWCILLPKEEQQYEDAVLNHQTTQVRRVSWTGENLSDSSKGERLKKIVKEAKEDNRKILVFSFYRETIKTVKSFFSDQCLGPIWGGVSSQERDEIITQFDTAPVGTILVAQIQAGGIGLNIQSASVVVICEPQWKPSIENQAISRAYRMGQTRNVFVHRLLCENTVDERVMAVLQRKQRVFDAFADQSVAAMESVEMDEKGFEDIIQAEIDRINAKRSQQSIKTTE